MSHINIPGTQIRNPGSRIATRALLGVGEVSPAPALDAQEGIA